MDIFSFSLLYFKDSKGCWRAQACATVLGSFASLGDKGQGHEYPIPGSHPQPPLDIPWSWIHLRCPRAAMPAAEVGKGTRIFLFSAPWACVCIITRIASLLSHLHQHFVLHTWPGVFVEWNTTALRQIAEAWEGFLPCTHMVSLTAPSSAPLNWIPQQNQGQPYWLHHRHLVPFLYQPSLSQNQLVLLESFPELPS